MEENKKSNKGLIVLVVILSILLIGAIGYICYDKFMAKEEPVADNEPQEEKLSEDEVKKLNDSLIAGNVSMFNGGYIFDKKLDFSYNIDDVSVDIIFPYVVQKYIDENNIVLSEKIGDICYNDESSSYKFFSSESAGKKLSKEDAFSITKDEIDNYLKKIFNTDKIFELDDAYFGKIGESNYSFVYFKEDNKLYLTQYCSPGSDVDETGINSKVLSFDYSENEIKIYSKVSKCLGLKNNIVCSNTGKAIEEGYVTNNKEYLTYNKGGVLDEQISKNGGIDSDYLLEKHGDVFNTYKTTFKKGNDGKYYWYSSEIVNE